MFKVISAIALSGALLFGTSACGNDNEYTEVCVDQYTQQRVDDSQCNPGHVGMSYPGYPYGYYFYPVYVGVPAVGYHVTNGYYRTLPPRAHMSRTYSHAPANGGVVKSKSVWNKPSTPKTNTGSTNSNKPKNTWNQPPKSNGGSYPKPASKPVIKYR